MATMLLFYQRFVPGRWLLLRTPQLLHLRFDASTQVVNTAL